VYPSMEASMYLNKGVGVKMGSIKGVLHGFSLQIGYPRA